MRKFVLGGLMVTLAPMLALGILELGFFALVKSRMFRPNVDGFYALAGNVRFHPISGYVYTGDIRYVRIGGGRVEYDQTYRLDRGEYFSRVHAGRAIPPTPGQKRILVFGDSYTDSRFYLPHTWIDRSEAILRADGRDLVFLPYALGGNGLASWHSVYRHWVALNEQFDLVVFAIFPDNLFRPILAAQATETKIHLRQLPLSPRGVDGRNPPQEIYRCDGVDVVSPSTLEWRIRIGRGDVAAEFNAARYLALHARRVFWSVYARRDCLGSQLTPVVSERMLADIRDDLAAKGKPVVFAIVPERRSLIAYIKGQPSPPLTPSVSETVRRIGTPLFNGYEAFRIAYERRVDRAVTADAFVNPMWFQYDGHWRQSGSDFFAESFAAFMADQLSK